MSDLIAVMLVSSFAALVYEDRDTAGEKLPLLGLACGLFARMCPHKKAHFQASAQLFSAAQEILDHVN